MNSPFSYWRSVLCILLLPSVVASQGVPGPTTGRITATTPVFYEFLQPDEPAPVIVERILAGETIASANADYTHQTPAGTYEYISEVVSTGGQAPQIQVSVATNIAPTEISFVRGGLGASATGELNYEVMIAQRATPPITFMPRLNLHADIAVEAHSDAGTSSAAEASVAIIDRSQHGINRYASAAVGANGSQSIAQRWALRAWPGDAIEVSLAATAVAFGEGEGEDSPAILDATAQAIADPVFSFDQDAFDREMARLGEDTFPLVDYYEITYSPSILAPPILFSDSFE